MKYWYQKPHEKISDYVRTVLVIEAFSKADPNALPLVTNGMPALLCRTEKDKTGKENNIHLNLFGKSISEDCLELSPSSTLIAYFFKPFTLASVFNIAASKLLDIPVDLSTWSPHQATALKTQLIYAKTTTQKIEILDQLIIQQLSQNKKNCEIIQYATDTIMCHPDIEILPIIQKELKLNERTFQRIFKKHVGITPVEYRRICQFQVSFANLRQKDFNSLTDVAYDSGFSDQSHFIRSFKEFTDVTPGEYLKTGLKGKT